VESKKANEIWHLSERHSAYAGTAADWRSFLSCWERARVVPGSLIGDAASGPQPVAEDVLELIREREAALGVRLPRSYVDFALAVHLPAESSYEDHAPLLLPVSGLLRLADFNGALVDGYLEFETPVVDRDYFVYGAAQRAPSRIGHLADAIVVGRYQRLDDVFILHPDTATLDGEMEAEAIFEGGSMRAPSFAEMMRQWSYYETTGIHGMPYSQRDLRGTCADLLPMKGVWWD
jgi:hypothetical protein